LVTFARLTAKSVADFAPRTAQRILIINRRDMRVAIDSSLPANVRAYGACAAAGGNSPQKTALPFFESK